MKNRRIASLLLLASLLWLPCHAKNMAVVVAKSNKTGDISTADLAKMFTSASQKWTDGSNVILILPGGVSSADAELVVERIFKMDQEEARKFLAAHRSSFVTGNSDADVLKKVESMPGAIGVVDVYSITGMINVLKVNGKLPFEPGYPLR
ncbi:MAG: hypothetical protein ACM3SW_01460 [Actinomycetota bacterium]